MLLGWLFGMGDDRALRVELDPERYALLVAAASRQAVDIEQLAAKLIAAALNCSSVEEALKNRSLAPADVCPPGRE